MSESFVWVRPATEANRVKVKTEKVGEVEYPVYISADADGTLNSTQTTAFGELSVADPTPVVQIQFPYGINSEIVDDLSNKGAISVDTGRLKLSTGASANQSARMQSRSSVKYNPGQGALIRFTCLFTTGVANSTQIIGIGDSGDGFFFGYNGADFGILRRHEGNPEVRDIQITTASTTAENITITLDGDANTVTVTNSNNVTTTANEIAADSGWADLGTGWSAHVEGDTVVFQSLDSAPHTGTYSITASTAAGTYTQQLLGVTQTDTWTAQTSWNVDKAIGEKTLPIMDWTKGNVFQIQYQWLGFGQICFFVENPATGAATLVHRIQYGNTNTVPSIQNPTLPLCAMAQNAANTSDLVMYTSSMAGFVEGKEGPASVRHGTTFTKTLSSSTIVPILTLHNQHLFQSKINRTRIKLTFVSVTNESGKPAILHFRQDATLTDASFSALEANSIMDVDTAATAISGGDEQFDIVLPSGTKEVINLSGLDFKIDPLSKFTIAGAQTTTGTNSVVTVSVNWEELF